MDYDEFQKNTKFKFTEDHKVEGYREYLSDGYSQIYVEIDENNKVKEIGIGNMDSGHIYFDSNKTSFMIDNNQIKLGMSSEEAKNYSLIHASYESNVILGFWIGK